VTIRGALTPGTARVDETARHYDALLLLSFGGPEGHDDVLPFLRNVAAGHGIPEERLAIVAEHYHHFGGVSPINAQNRALIEAVRTEFASHGIPLPIYFGNRNWHPYVSDTVREMRDHGVRRAIVFVTSVFSSYSGCRQYREDVLRACETVGEGAPIFDKIRSCYNHPGFIEAMADRVSEALAKFPGPERDSVRVVFTAHSIPRPQAQGSDYVAQLEEACRLVMESLGRSGHALVYQSRSGSPRAPWLEPDILEHLPAERARGVDRVVVAPIGFISDHMEVIYDLDTQATELAEKIGIRMVRAATVATHPAFVRTIRELVLERMIPGAERRALGTRGPSHDICPMECCLKGESRPHAASGS
jgi:ferrochelatase